MKWTKAEVAQAAWNRRIGNQTALNIAACMPQLAWIPRYVQSSIRGYILAERHVDGFARVNASERQERSAEIDESRKPLELLQERLCLIKRGLFEVLFANVDVQPEPVESIRQAITKDRQSSRGQSKEHG